MSKGWDVTTMPEGSGLRDLDITATVRQIGSMNVLSVSGGRVGRLVKDGEVVGLELPVSNGYKVRVFLDASDTYTVQRVWREKVKGEQTDVYAEEIGEVVYQAGMFRSNDFGGHRVGV
jgi:hypothetical protein